MGRQSGLQPTASRLATCLLSARWGVYSPEAAGRLKRPSSSAAAPSPTAQRQVQTAAPAVPRSGQRRLPPLPAAQPALTGAASRPTAAA